MDLNNLKIVNIKNGYIFKNIKKYTLYFEIDNLSFEIDVTTFKDEIVQNKTCLSWFHLVDEFEQTFTKEQIKAIFKMANDYVKKL